MKIKRKYLIFGGIIGTGVLLLFTSHLARARLARAYQVYGMGFSGPTEQLSPDVPTPNCAPVGMGFSNGGGNPCPPGQAAYRYSATDQSEGYLACGVNCADARAQYQNKYNPGDSVYGSSCPTCASNVGLGGTPIVDTGYGDIANSYGFQYASQVTGMSPAMGFAQPQSPYGYGYGYSSSPPPPMSPYGYGMPAPPSPYGYGYGYGYPQPSLPPPNYGYGYGYPSGYGYGYPMI